MVFLLDKLRLKNNFNLLKLEPRQAQLSFFWQFNINYKSTIEGDKFHYEKPFINHLREVKKEPLLLLKHHFIFDFAQHGLRQPTMINVVRDPVDWFVSQDSGFIFLYLWLHTLVFQRKPQGNYQQTRHPSLFLTIILNMFRSVSPTYV